MAHPMNVFGAVITFLGSSALAYGMWNPVITFIQSFPTELYVLAACMWILLIVGCMVIAPYMMIVSDERD